MMMHGDATRGTGPHRIFISTGDRSQPLLSAGIAMGSAGLTLFAATVGYS